MKDKIEKPQSFFKYKSFVDQTLDSLMFNYYWAQPISKMNDVFEGLNAFEKFKTRIYKIGDANKRNRFIEDFESLEFSIQNTVGTLCLTTDSLNQLMWAHYGDSCKGLCIEYGEDIVNSCNESFLVKVQYKQTIPEFIPDDMRNSEVLLQKLGGTKNAIWAYEKEYRIIHSVATKSINYKRESIKAIYFGSNFEEGHRNEVYQALWKNNVKYYQMVKSEFEYTFRYEEIIDVPKYDYYVWSDKELGGFEFDYEIDAFDKNRGTPLARVFIYTKEFVSSELLSLFNKHLRSGLLNGIENSTVVVYLEREKIEDVPLAYYFFNNDCGYDNVRLVLDIYKSRSIKVK